MWAVEAAARGVIEGLFLVASVPVAVLCVWAGYRLLAKRGLWR